MEPHRQDGPPVFAPRDEAVTQQLFVRRPSPALLQGMALITATVGYPLAWTVLAIMSSLTALDRTLRHTPDQLRETLGLVDAAAFWTSWTAALAMAALGRRHPATIVVSAACAGALACVMACSALEGPLTTLGAALGLAAAAGVAGLSLASRRSRPSGAAHKGA